MASKRVNIICFVHSLEILFKLKLLDSIILFCKKKNYVVSKNMTHCGV